MLEWETARLLSVRIGNVGGSTQGDRCGTPGRGNYDRLASVRICVFGPIREFLERIAKISITYVMRRTARGVTAR